MNNPIINALSSVMNDRLASYFGMLPPGEEYSDMYTVSIEDDPNMTDVIDIVIECPDIDGNQFRDLRPALNRVINKIYPHSTFDAVSTGVFVAQIPKSRLASYSQDPEINPALSQRSIETLADMATVRVEDLFPGTFNVEDYYYSRWDNTLEVAVKSDDSMFESSAKISIDPTQFYDYETFQEIYLGPLVRELEENMEEL